MREFNGNILENLMEFDGICITSNGTIKNNGACVMGAGIAKAVRDGIPGIDLELGRKIKKNGNVVNALGEIKLITGTVKLFSFPVKHNWYETADIKLIEASLIRLNQIVEHYNLYNVALPRPGCGNGKLNWEKDVKPVIENLVSDRIIICSF